MAYGWAVSEDGIKRVSGYVEPDYFERRCIGASSVPRVNKMFPGFPQGTNAGWTVDLDIPFSAGKYEDVSAAESLAGAIRDFGLVPVTIVRQSS